MSVFIGNKEFLDCTECPRCKPKDGLKHGVRYGICGMGGNLVYLEPWKKTEPLILISYLLLTYYSFMFI